MDIEKELIKEFRSMDNKKKHVIVLNPRTKIDFISYDRGRITSPLIINNGMQKHSLVLKKSEKLLSKCDELLKAAIYNTINGPTGSFEYGFMDNGEEVFVKPTDFTGIIDSSINNINRIIQFHQKNNEEIFQWERIKFQSLGVLSSNVKINEVTGINWFNYDSNGFILVTNNPNDRTLITSINAEGTFGKITKDRLFILNRINSIWPELELVEDGILYSRVLMKLFPSIQPGIIKLINYYETTTVECIQTHLSCC